MYRMKYIYWSGAHCIKLLPEIKLVKFENSGKHEFTIDFTTGRTLRLKITSVFSGKSFMQ